MCWLPPHALLTYVRASRAAGLTPSRSDRRKEGARRAGGPAWSSRTERTLRKRPPRARTSSQPSTADPTALASLSGTDRLVHLHWLPRGHLQDAAKPPGLRGRQDSRLPVEGAVPDGARETIGMDKDEQSRVACRRRLLAMGKRKSAEPSLGRVLLVPSASQTEVWQGTRIAVKALVSGASQRGLTPDATPRCPRL